MASPWSVDAQSVISTVAGGGPGNGPALATPLGFPPASPAAIALDTAGNVFIAAPLLNRIIKVAATGQATMVAGNSAFGFSGDGGLATAATLASPSGVTVDGDGNVYIADQSNHRIRRVDAATGIITTVAGNGTIGFSGDLGPATAANLRSPSGVTVDSLGNLFIVDQGNHRIRKVDTAGTITTVAGTGTEGFSGDGGAATSASLRNPSSVAIDGAGNLFIADLSNHRVRKVDAITGGITTVAGTGTFAFSGDGGLATNAGLANPSGVDVDGAGNIFIADFSNQRVRKIDAAGVITTVAGTGTFGFSGDGGLANSALLASPASVAVHSDGTLFIADLSNQRIRRVAATDGVITTVAGNGTSRFSGDGGSATAASLADPDGVAVDSVGNIFIVDASNHRVRKVDAATRAITTVAGNGAEAFGGDGGPAIDASLQDPSGVAADGAGNLFIADLTNQRIRRVDATTGIITTVAGNGIRGFSGDGGAATSASLRDPSGVAVDGVGNIFIADTVNRRIRKVAATTGVITTVAGNGTVGFSGDGGPATGAQLGNPTSVDVDSTGNLFIADLTNQRIRRVDATTGIITTVAGNGIRGFSGDGGAATSASLQDPSGIAVDDAGDLFIADLTNQRVRRVNAASGVITTVAGTGSSGFSGDGGPATSATLTNPSGVAVNSAGSLFIADVSNQRIRLVTAPDLVETAVTNPPATGTRGTRFSVTDTVRNQGGGRARATTTRYYLSVDRIRNAGDQILTGLRAVPALLPAATSTGTVMVTIPNTTTFGTYFLLACADNGAQAAESNETNNCSGSVTAMLVGPDLVETTVTNPPATATRGTPFSVTDAVRNRGGAPAPATTTRYYLSVDKLRNAGDQLLIGTRAVPALAAGATSTGTVTVTIPPTTVFRTYFLLACADDLAPQVGESNETNNCLASVTTVRVGPDLVEIAVSNPPATATPGTRFSVTDTVRNLGGAPAPATTTRYYLSVDKLRNAGDKLLIGTRAVPALLPGASSTGRVTVTIPTTTVFRAYFLLACADNGAPLVAESNETNNCSASVTAMRVGPDLVETAVTNPPASARRGARFAVTDTVRNLGAAAPATTTRYYLSVDRLRNAGDKLLIGTRAVPALGPGATSTGTVTVTIPTTTVFRTYFLLACADNGTPLAAESNETNNCRASARTVVVQP